MCFNTSIHLQWHPLVFACPAFYRLFYTSHQIAATGVVDGRLTHPDDFGQFSIRDHRWLSCCQQNLRAFERLVIHAAVARELL